MDPILKNLIRVGKVVALDTAKHQARVIFEDKPATVSFWLDIIVRNTYKNKDYALPDIDEEVICLFLPNGNAQGFILGAVYNADDLPPVDDKDKRHVEFEDGSVIEYDRNTHKLTADLNGDIDITTTGSVNITAAQDVNVTGDISVTGDVIADGISLKTHVHGGVTTGGSSTSGPSGGGG